MSSSSADPKANALAIWDVNDELLRLESQPEEVLLSRFPLSTIFAAWADDGIPPRRSAVALTIPSNLFLAHLIRPPMFIARCSSPDGMDLFSTCLHSADKRRPIGGHIWSHHPFIG